MPEEVLYRDKKYTKYYDKIYSDRDYEGFVKFVEEILDKYDIKGKKIIDVACGTGEVSRMLSEKGYFVTGIDKNPEMLKIARKKGGGRYFEGRMQSFDLDTKFDALICLFTSINYNRNKNELLKTLKSFYRNLKSRGIAIFDLGLIDVAAKNSPYLDTYSEEDLRIARLGFLQKSDENSSLYDADFLIFVKEGDRVDFEIDKHKLRRFNQNDVKELSEKVGFKTHIHDGFTLKKRTKEHSRPVFVCLKEP